MQHPAVQTVLSLVPRLVLLGALLSVTGGVNPVPWVHAAGTDAPAARADRCSDNGSFVWGHLERCGWPGPGNTGPRASRCPGDTLAPRGSDPSSVIHVTRRDATISCRRIVGCLDVRARGVTIRDVAVRCTTGRRGEAANGSGVITVANGASATIRRVATNGMRGVHACIWHQGRRVVVKRLDCRHANDGVFSWSDTGYSQTTGDNFEISGSWFHDFTTRTANGHVDGYQTEGASHGLIRHNTWLMTSDDQNAANSAIAIWDSLRSSRDITVRHNLVAGGGFSVYAHDYSPSDADPRGGHSVEDVRFVDNVFSRHLFGCVGYYGVWFPRGEPTDGWRRHGNTVLETGSRIDRENPSYRRRPCT
ncbi:hypothetical protein ACT8ZV_00850 [Nocardioides sp. MAHUQ-72]|uniref:hypothetical protein n=1 Tax=unclassified Nocardioides TaxID=2615069 RepID=UPI0036171ADB